MAKEIIHFPSEFERRAPEFLVHGETADLGDPRRGLVGGALVGVRKPQGRKTQGRTTNQTGRADHSTFAVQGDQRDRVGIEGVFFESVGVVGRFFKAVFLNVDLVAQAVEGLTQRVGVGDLKGVFPELYHVVVGGSRGDPSKGTPGFPACQGGRDTKGLPC